MTQNRAVKAFAALGQETRLRIFRLLLQEGPNGLPAGKISVILAVPPSTLSTHLSVLESAVLIRSHRAVRQIFYAASVEGTRALLAYLTRDCCQGRVEICGELAALADLNPIEANEPVAENVDKA